MMSGRAGYFDAQCGRLRRYYRPGFWLVDIRATSVARPRTLEDMYVCVYMTFNRTIHQESAPVDLVPSGPTRRRLGAPDPGTLQPGCGGMVGMAAASSRRVLLDVGGQDRHGRLHGDRLAVGVALDADVAVGDQGQAGVAQAQLAGQVGLGILGHVDDVHAGRRVPARLGPGREAGALDHHDRARCGWHRAPPDHPPPAPARGQRPARSSGQYGSAKLTCSTTSPSR